MERAQLLVTINIEVKMALTATATKTMQVQVSRVLGMRKPFVIAVSPCKKNTVYVLRRHDSIEKTFQPIVDRLRLEHRTMPRTIVYCRSYNDCSNLYIYFRTQLGEMFTDPPDAPDLSPFRLVDVYTSCTEESVKGHCQVIQCRRGLPSYGDCNYCIWNGCGQQRCKAGYSSWPTK